MTLSRSQKFALRKVTSTKLIPNRSQGIGNVSAYVQSAVEAMPPIPTTHISPTGSGRKVRFAGSFSSRTIVNDERAMGYLAERVNREYDRTGRLPSVETVQGWV